MGVEGLDEGEINIDAADDLHSIHSQSGDERRPVYTEFRASTDMGKLQLKVGMLFASATEFKQALREYAIQQGKDITFVKNETTRVRAICTNRGCKWVVYGSLLHR